MLYLYALLGGRPAEPGDGLDGRAVQLLDCRGLLAAVSLHAERPAPSVEALCAHERVVSRLAGQVSAILPARFGQVSPDSEALLRGLGERLPALRGALARLDGCVQMDLRLFGEQRPQPPAPAPAAAGGPGSRYLLERVAARRRERRVPELDPLLERLSDLVREERVRRSERSSLLASVYHLVGREDAPAYAAQVEALAPAIAPYRLRMSGPWAPYAFAPGVGA